MEVADELFVPLYGKLGVHPTLEQNLIPPSASVS